MKTPLIILLHFSLGLVSWAETTIQSTKEETSASTSIPKKNMERILSVEKVVDGDTIKVTFIEGATGERKETIRLKDIDAPEKDQPGGEEASKILKALLLSNNGKSYEEGDLLPYMIMATWTSKDRNGRLIADLRFMKKTSGGESTLINISEDMVRRGYAWHYKQFAPDNKTLEDLEKKARELKVGIWKEKSNIAPWDWRKLSKEEKEKHLKESALVPPAVLDY